MALARPVVSVYQFDNPSEKKGGIALPHVLASPLRPDWVRRVFKDVSKNTRQPYAVSSKAGYETAAESWGTGRAVARVPRAPGGGTHRSGQGAFGNMCRGGGMFSPTKTWRRWHRRSNLREKRNAVVTALAASCLPPLVMARGHRIEEVAELPLVISDGIESIAKTKATVRILEKLGFKDEMEKLNNTRKIRAGKGKVRNRRYVKRIGPMIIYNEDNGIGRATQNIIGIEAADVKKLNILKLAPGGNFRRCLIWTESAFRKLHDIYGTLKSGCPMKKRYTLPRAQMENADIARIINSTEVQSVLRPKLEAPKTYPKKKNALKNKHVMKQLNPYEKPVETDEQRKKRVAERKQRSKEYNKKHKRGEDTFFKKLLRAYEPKKEADEDKAPSSEGE
jgi:large subunit ribosomal protein L4e